MKKKVLFIGVPVLLVSALLSYHWFLSSSSNYLSVSQVVAQQNKMIGRPITVNGRIYEGSINWDGNKNILQFELTEKGHRLKISYPDMAPDTFKYGVDVIVEGKLTGKGMMKATKLMTGCPNKYEA